MAPPSGASFRLGVPTPSVTPVTGAGQVTPQDYIGQRLVNGKPAAYALPTSNEYLIRYSEGVRRGRRPELSPRGLVKSVTGQMAAIREAEALLHVLEAWPDDDYRAAEPEHLQKAVMQSGYCPGWQFIEGGLSRATSAALGLEEEALLLEKYLYRFATPGWPKGGVSYPRGKFKGLPFLTRSDAALPVCAAMAALIGNRETAEEVMDYVITALGATTLSTVPLSAVQFTRTGPLRKPQPYWRILRDGAYLEYMVTGTYPRRRHVNAQPSFTNMAARMLAVSAKLWLRSATSFHHVGRQLTAYQVRSARNQGLEIWSDDISGYDKSVSREHQLSLYGVWRRNLPDTGVMDLYEWAALDMPTLSPGWDDADGKIIVYGKDAGISSGHIGTSVDGGAINWMRTVSAVGYATGWGSQKAAARLGTDWHLWVWGDDTLIAIPKGFDGDKYTERNEALGYATKLSKAPVFLMTCYPKDGPPTNLASRTYAQSVWREHEQMHLVMTIFGLWTRFSLLAGHPAFELTWRAVARAALPDGELRSRRIATFGDLDRHVRMDAFRLEMKKALQTDPQGAATLIDSLTRGSGDVRDNPDSSFALALLGADVLRDREWRAPGRLGLRGVDEAEKRKSLDTAISVYLGWMDKAEAEKGWAKSTLTTAPSVTGPVGREDGRGVEDGEDELDEAINE